MNKHIKRLQTKLQAGKITADEYMEQLAELLEDELVTKEEHDDAKDFEVEDPNDKPIYSQADFDRSIVAKARQMVKKALTSKGVDIEKVDKKDLLDHFAEMALQGQKKGNLSVDEQELAALQVKAKSADVLQPKIQQLTIENAVLKAAGKYNPVNPKQVVRALDDYSDLLEYDEDDVLVGKSVETALAKLAKAEPNLFQSAEDDATPPPGDDNPPAGGLKGKTPGGSTPPPGGKKKDDDLKAQALEMLGIKKDQ